jgi:hypothetical protein
MTMATVQWGAWGGEPPLLLPCIAEGRQAASTHLVMEGRRSRSPRFLLPFFLMTTLALSASNASASCCITKQQQGKQVTKKRVSAYRRHHDEHAQKQQDMGDGAGPQHKYGIGGIYATTGKPNFVLRDTLCSCEPYGMRSKYNIPGRTTPRSPRRTGERGARHRWLGPRAHIAAST